MSPKQTQPTIECIDKIKNDIRQSGFPLELHILNICSTKNTGRMPSLRYEYQGDFRELDLLTSFETMDFGSRRAVPQHTSTNLIIECKKSRAKPWIFFSSPPFESANLTFFLKYWSDFDSHFSSTQAPSLLAQIFPNIRDGHYAAEIAPKCISYYEAFSGTSGPREIYRAIDSVITYLNYRRPSRLNRREGSGNFSEFYLPVIVLDGLLFEASVNKDEIDVRPRLHVQLRTFHRESLYVIDIVTRDHFDQFFNEVEHFHEQLVSAIRSIRFSSDFKTTLRSRVKRGLESAPGWAKDMASMAVQESRAKESAARKVLRRSKKQQKN